MHKSAEHAPLAENDRTLVAYARSLTLAPHAQAPERVDSLRAVGFSDAAILAATELVAYFNFVNRLAEGLGVELEKT